MRSTITAIAFILWFILGFFYYRSCVECCHAEDTKTTAAAVVAEELGPILFNWNQAEPITQDSWNSIRQGHIDNLSENEKLEIIGYYRADEANTSSYENLGLARAHETASLFTPPLREDQITRMGKLVTDDVERNSLFESVKITERMVTTKIQEIDDEATIYFPYNSTNKLDDNEVETYLDKVVERIQRTGERVQITGHTDHIGPEPSNERLGQWRANVIKDYLNSQGLSDDKIITLSRGESAPVANNDTEEGRALNRRTVLKIIK